MPYALTAALVLVLVGQSPAPSPAAPAPFTLESQLQSQFRAIRTLVTKAADAMPEEDYTFQPTPDVRTFAASVAHAAATNFGMCANLVGRPNPMKGVDLEKTATSKADVTKALADSFAFCDQYARPLVAAGLTETYDATSVGPTGQRSSIAVARGGLFANLIEHNNEMYGYLAVYLRLKGILPPSSAQRGRGGRVEVE